MKNATLIIKNGKGFEDDIWQLDNAEFKVNQWISIINNFADNAQAIYDWLDEHGEGFNTRNFDLYILGDTINMLRSIDVEMEEKR